MTITVTTTSGQGIVTAGKLVAFDRVATFSLTGLSADFYATAVTGLLTTADGKTALAALATATVSGTGTATLEFDTDSANMLELMGPGKSLREYTALLTVYATATTEFACRAVIPLVMGARSGTTTASTEDATATLAEVAALVGTLYDRVGQATLPTGGDIVTGLVFHLTAADATAKAGQGLYMHDGTAWACLVCLTAYAWGNLGATPTTALIAGCDYVFVRDQAITGWTLTLSRPGVCNWTLTGAFACADPTCTGRTFVERETTWSDNIVSALIEGAFRDDGTRMICSAVELNT